MKATEQDWIKATENLIERRSKNGLLKLATEENKDYTSYLNNCGYGKSVLDVGCGSQTLRLSLPEYINYIGIDAFPIVEDAIKIAIEDLSGAFVVDTVCAFAVLDNCRDFFKACENMKRSARQNVIILTGIGIEVDEYHTFKLEHEHFEQAFSDWDCTHKEELTPKVWLLCYRK